jgi:hypothetical protein
MGYIPNFFILCVASWERFEVREGVGKREFPVAEVLKPRGFKEQILFATGSNLPLSANSNT